MREKKVPERFFKLMARQFAALSDPTRLAVIHTLMKRGEQNVTQLSEQTGRSHQVLSKHLRLLREMGIVSRRKQGMQVFYKIDNLLTEKLCKIVCESLLKELEADKDAC